MLITTAALNALRKGFKAHFQSGIGQEKTLYQRIATTVLSTAGEETYGWLGEMPEVREWIGDRHVHGLKEHDYAIKNKDFELTIGVQRNKIKDDTIGVYKPVFEGFGRKVAAHPDKLVFGLLKDGANQKCYDGQSFFDTDHPVLDAEGNTYTVSNDGGGAGTPWYLLCTSEVIKPIIYQEREAFDFVALDNPTDANVFKNKEFLYGTDGRCNVGFGFWQTAFVSRQPLTAANYEAARVAVQSMKADYGEPLNLSPDVLMVPPALEGAANRLMKNDQIDGSDNEWKGTAEVLMVSRLA
ncbi:Mu-like prophage major head subunit gpT family protein [Leisingera sp. NJS204]|uniref:Mu-like prophage major head subunit gpT family protein n=1 Tax=Leisingera sp. NJS204 TaxID=2508307 RepID=UPI0010107A00|nr:Mu-like prophage major head subunit gpT family protein [Leisingera sp. NJS204]QAX29274.1 hypothetical protein ETW24_07855 [Leisingera sp. NJS204]